MPSYWLTVAKACRTLSLGLLLALMLPAVSHATKLDPDKALNWELSASVAHNPASFTQGLVLQGQTLWESTGLRGKSSLHKLDVASGEILRKVKLPRKYFGEGLTLAGNRLYQLSWKRGRVFIYNSDTLKKVGNWYYRGEGWGLTYNGRHFIMSDGTATLQWRNSSDFSFHKKIDINYDGQPLAKINELEWINGLVFANVWQQAIIYVINPANGAVIHHLNLQSLAIKHQEQGVLNGIAWDKDTQELLVTGKYWDALYRLKIELP